MANLIAELQGCGDEEQAKITARGAVSVLREVAGSRKEKKRIEKDLEDIFLKFPSAEACFRDELRDVVCKLLIAEAPDPTKSGLEAGCIWLMESPLVAKHISLPDLLCFITRSLERSDPSSVQCALKLFIFFGQQNQQVLGAELLSPGQLSPVLTPLLHQMLTVLLFQPQAFEEAHLAARAMTVLLKCLEKEGTNISQSFVWLFLQVLHGYTVPEEDMKLGCVSVAAANLVHNLTDFQRHFALLSFMKALVSSDNNIILFTEGSLKIPLLLSFFEIIKELYSRLEDTQLVYQYFQVCAVWLECLHTYMSKAVESKIGPNVASSEMNVERLDFFLGLVWNHGDNPIEGVSQLVVEIFKNVLRVYQIWQNQDPTGDTADLFDKLCDQLLRLPWHIKGRYALLEVLLQYVDHGKILKSPSLLAELQESMATNSLAPAASHYYEAALLMLVGSKSPVEEWQKYWFKAVIGCLLGNHRLQRHNTRQYWLPATCRLIPGAFHVMLEPIRLALLRQQALEGTPPVEEPPHNEETPCNEEAPPCEASPHDKRTADSTEGESVLLVQEASFDLLLHAMLALLRVGREHKLVQPSLVKENEDVISLGLKHWDDSLRMEGLALLTTTVKSLEPLASFEMVLLEEGITQNLNLASAASRQKFAALLKKLTCRVRESSLALHRALVKARRRKTSDPSEIDALEDQLTSSMKFLQWLVDKGVSCLYPRASYQSMRCGLALLAAVYEVFVQVEGEGPRRKGGVPDGASALLDWAEKKKVCRLTDKSAVAALLCCLIEGRGDIPGKAADMLTAYFRWPGGVRSQDDFTVLEVLNQALRLCSTPGTASPEIGAQLFRMVLLRCDSSQLFTVEPSHEKVQLTADMLTYTAVEGDSSKTTHSAQLHLIGQLVSVLELFHCHGNTDILHAAIKLPLHGLLQALHLCLAEFLTHYKPPEVPSLGESPVDPVQALLCRVLAVSQKICDSVITTLSLSTGSLSEEELGISPSFADMGLAIERAIVSPHSGGTDLAPDVAPHPGDTGPAPDLAPHPRDTDPAPDVAPHPRDTDPAPDVAPHPRHADVTSIEYQLVLSYCWLALKETSAVLAVIAQKLSGLGQGVWSVENWRTTGDILISILLKCRHKGAIEAAEAAFIKFCSSVHAHHCDAVRALVPAWLTKVLDVVTTGSSVSSITRQSAGIPKCIEAVVTTEPKHHQSVLLKTCVETLLKCASMPVVGLVSDTVDLPQVQAMNMLKVLFRSTRSGSAILQFAAKGMTLAISSLASPHWAIRNAATLLYGALVLRMLGHRVVVDEHGRRNTLAVNEFFARYPLLEPFLLDRVQRGVDLVKEEAGRMCPSVYPTLLLLSKLTPPTTPGAGLRYSAWQEYRECIEQLAGASQHDMRTVAASALVAFVGEDHLEPVLIRQLQKVPTSLNMDIHHNEIHGLLLQASALLAANHFRTKLNIVACERLEKELKERLWLSTSCNPCPLTRRAYLCCLKELSGRGSGEFDELCYLAVNNSLAAMVAYANEQGSPQAGDVVWMDSSLQLFFSILHSQMGAFDVDSAADTVCNLLQCTNTDIVSAVLRHISECEVSISTLFTERALCTMQTCLVKLFESKQVSVAAMQAYASIPHAIEDVDAMNNTFAFLLHLLKTEGEGATLYLSPSVTAAALSALGNLLEGALTKSELWNKIAEQLERSLELYSQLVHAHSQAEQYGFVRLATAAMLRRVGPLLLVMCEEAGPLPPLMAPEVDVHAVLTAAIQSWRAAVLLLQDEDEEVRFEAVKMARELTEDTSRQCVGLSAASSLELLFTYFANHYWWSGEGWDALESLFSLKPPSLGDREGPIGGSDVLFEPEAANPYHEDLPLYCLASKALKSVFMQVCQWSSGFLGNSPLPQQLLSWLQRHCQLVGQTLLEASTCLSQMERLNYLRPSSCQAALVDSFVSCVYFMTAAGSVVVSDCREEQDGYLTWLFDMDVLVDSIKLWGKFARSLPVIANAAGHFVAGSKVQPSVLVLSSREPLSELAALSLAPPHALRCDHHGNKTLFDRLVQLEPNYFNLT